MANVSLHVAIIGGGLCGISLAIALTKRGISHIIYESRASFTEIGAGINLGPNCIEAFSLIDPLIGDQIYSLVTRNPDGGDVWSNVRLGAATKHYDEAKLIHQTHTAPAATTGSMTASRNELLQFLAQRTNREHARFNKKLVAIRQSEEGVRMTFEDGTQETASVMIACDGAHSVTRRLLLGADHPATPANFTHVGAYRGVFPKNEMEKIIGREQAENMTVRVGPGGYIINYPIDGGRNVNVGFWRRYEPEWTSDSWILPGRKHEMLEYFQPWGPIAHKIMDRMEPDTAFWATFDHSNRPESYFRGRVCLIGDSAHAAAPHQGQGASQAMEDACVMAEVLSSIQAHSETELDKQIHAAFVGYETVRKPRFEKVMQSSNEAFALWSDFWDQDISDHDIEDWRERADARFKWVWQADIAGQCARAKVEMNRAVGANGIVDSNTD